MGNNYCGPSGTWIHRLNGDTGEAEDTIHIPEAEVPCVFGGGAWGFGYYGAAVDPENNLWLSTFGGGKLVRVDYETLEYTVYNGSSYGVTVDTMGRPWVGDSPRRFNPQINNYDNPPNGTLPGAGGSGIAEDHEGRMWAATSNGVGWSPDATLMYYVDTPTRRIDVLDFDNATGTVANRRPLAHVGNTDGWPDGLCVDADGCVWVALWGGHAVRRYTPSGELDREIELPVDNPTACCFGGQDFTDLYVTSARVGLSDQALMDRQLNGSVLVLPGVGAGLPGVAFNG